MALCDSLVPAALLFLSAAAALGQQQTTPNSGASTTQPAAPIIQPGSPGRAGKVLSPANATPPSHSPADADTSFMQGMIMHHSQAVEMTELLRTRTQNKALRSLGQRISISQTDEMQYMKQWLTDRGKPISMSHGHMDMADMKGMDHMNMGDMPMMMPGMLTPQQMKDLERAKGPAFDHLFLTGMIQHHTGALIMVQDLFDTPGAGQDNVLFDFATDVDNTQRAEIDIMRSMLKEKR